MIRKDLSCPCIEDWARPIESKLDDEAGEYIPSVDYYRAFRTREGHIFQMGNIICPRNPQFFISEKELDMYIDGAPWADFETELSVIAEHFYEESKNGIFWGITPENSAEMIDKFASLLDDFKMRAMKGRRKLQDAIDERNSK